MMLLGWVNEEDEYICVYAVSLPLLDSKTLLAPEATVDDGTIWLCIVRKGATKVSVQLL